MAGSIARVVLFTTALVAAASATRAQEPTWTTRGPTALANVTALGASGGVAYAGTFNGVLRSEDARTWSAAGPAGRLISQIDTDETGRFVYAVDTAGPLWVSQDGGH